MRALKLKVSTKTSHRTLTVVCTLFLVLFRMVSGTTTHAGANGWLALRISILWQIGCPHCAKAVNFLERLDTEIPALEVEPLDVAGSPANQGLLVALAQAVDSDQVAAPLIVIGQRISIG